MAGSGNAAPANELTGEALARMIVKEFGGVMVAAFKEHSDYSIATPASPSDLERLLAHFAGAGYTILVYVRGEFVDLYIPEVKLKVTYPPIHRLRELRRQWARRE